MINKIVIIFVLFTVSFIQPNNRPKIKDGAIFGKVAFYNVKNTKPFEITLMETNKVVEHDSEGYFYINSLKPGIYNLRIQTEGLMDHSAEKIEVLNGMITCLQPFYMDRLDTVKGKIEWDLLEYQKKIEPIRYGKIEGYIVDLNGRPVQNALISYNDNKYPSLGNEKDGKCLWEGKSDSNGYFKINKVVPGHYPEISVHGWMTKATNIVVRPNHITRVKPAIILGQIVGNKIDPRLAAAFNLKIGLEIPEKIIRTKEGKYTKRVKVSTMEIKSFGIDLDKKDPRIDAMIRYKGDFSDLIKLGFEISEIKGDYAFISFPLSQVSVLNNMDNVIYVGLMFLVKLNSDQSAPKVRAK
ncbi:MAG: carboxypeptidase-like regulatory domain-containing protein [Bacteroidota bacterium]|nr:carboxypeptidase-like regulatory domain-containing protein [Bacteroidota bacterium]